jgi:SNF2 family DNA or RNA helicase
MAKKKEQKTVILFAAQELLKSNFLWLLQITKQAEKTTYDTYQFDANGIKIAFGTLHKVAKEILHEFTFEMLEKTSNAIKAKYKLGRSGLDYEQFYNNAVERELHNKFVRLKPFFPAIKWHQKIWVQSGKAVTSPCSFSAYTPQLQFEVISKNEELLIQPKISLNGTAYNLQEFNRYYFFVESNREYFILGYKDSQTLDWLAAANAMQYSHDSTAFATNILAPLEENYPVNRNGYFEQNLVETTPVNRVMLSEISGSFLVLTPQWVYDGFIAEGNWVESFEVTKMGAAYLIKRNKESETNFIKTLQNLHPNFTKQFNGYYYLSFADAQKKQWFLKVYHFLLEQNIQVVGMDMLQHFRYSSHKATSTFTIDDNNKETLTITFTLAFGEEQIPLASLQKMVLNGQKAILLKDGSLGILNDEWLQQYSTIIKHGKINKQQIEVARWLALTEEKTKLEAQVLKPLINKEWWTRWQLWQEEDTTLFEVPAAVNASLRKYQHKGFEWLILLAEAGAGACLADDMGLGKTLQAISFFAYRLQQSPKEKYLVVCPTSLVYNWVQELQKFIPHVKSVVYHGPQRNLEDVTDKDNQIVITTYGTLRSDIEKITGTTFDVAVIDESHNIKNPAAIITRAVNQIQAGMRIALSGTPVMNNTFDLYAQLNFLLPGMFGNREFFKREYADAIDRDQDEDKIAALQKLTAPFILRRTKEQVATDLPEKMESVLWCEMGDTQQMAYNNIRDSVRNSIFLDVKDNQVAKGGLNLLNAMLKLRQACNSCALLQDEDNLSTDSVKQDILIDELLNIIPNHKALVFSQFTSMLNLLEPALKKHQIPFCRLDGTTPINHRQQLVNDFQQTDSVAKVFLISLKAGNAGLNLTAADYVFIFDPWWNTAVEQQAIDRTHRIGQTKNIFAYKMICKGTIEEKIMLLQQRKKKLAKDLIGEEEGFVKNLTEDDIAFLLSS